MPIKTTLRYHFSSVRMPNFKKRPEIGDVGKDVEIKGALGA